MPSRVKAIRTAIETHVTASFAGITITNDPKAFDSLQKHQFPHAIIIFTEDDPERLDFKQERRRVIGEVAIADITTPGDTAEATREDMDLKLETIRDAIFADPDLSATVDDVSCDAAFTSSGQEDAKVYGTLDIVAEEIF